MNLNQRLGTARLLTAVFVDHSLRDIFITMGLELCPWEHQSVVCREPNINSEYYPYCAHPHKQANYFPQKVIALICHDCGIRFYREKRTHLRNLSKGQEHTFCGKECFGRWAGNTHGFRAHPENTGSGRPRQSSLYCAKGHLLTPENTYTWKTLRQCKTCNRERAQRHAQAKRNNKLTKHMREHW